MIYFDCNKVVILLWLNTANHNGCIKFPGPHLSVALTSCWLPDLIWSCWVPMSSRTLYVEGYDSNRINHYIQTCFGGDSTFCGSVSSRGLGPESIYVLLQHLGCAPSSKSSDSILNQTLPTKLISSPTLYKHVEITSKGSKRHNCVYVLFLCNIYSYCAWKPHWSITQWNINQYINEYSPLYWMSDLWD